MDPFLIPLVVTYVHGLEVTKDNFCTVTFFVRVV